MSRLMSVSHTEAAVVARTKTVTRRLGWLFLKPGDTVTLCRKVMGRRAGEPLVRLAEVEIVNVRREPLWDITEEDIAREGVPLIDADGTERFAEVWFPDDGSWADAQPTPLAWVQWFTDTMRCDRPDVPVTRIEWRYLDGAVSP